MQAFSNYKGKEFVELLQTRYKKYKKYTINFYINGQNMPKYEISDFYKLVKSYRLHCLLHLNKWGETYCYGLSLALNTGLPILYNDIGAYKERIPSREHYFKAYDSENDYVDTKKLYENFEKMLNYIINNNRQCDHDSRESRDLRDSRDSRDLRDLRDLRDSRKSRDCMTKNLKIKYQPFYDRLFGHEIKNQVKLKIDMTNVLNMVNVVLVPSKIYTSKTSLSYSPIRSIYSAKNRFTQTLNTFISIRKFIPNSFIIFIDNSDFTNEEYERIKQKVNIFVKPESNSHLTHLSDEYPNKGRAELFMLKQLKGFIPKNVANLFKISARYLINEKFKYKFYDNKNNFFKKAIPNEKFNYPKGYYFTCFYKISRQNIEKYFNAISQLYETYEVKKDLEVQLPKALKYDFYEIDILGVIENISVFRYIKYI